MECGWFVLCWFAFRIKELPCYSIILVRLRNTPDSRSLARERDDTHLRWNSESTGLIEFEYSDARGHRVSKPL